jgi:hypothetical protein
MNDKLLLVRFFWDCGRMGDLDGLFVCTERELEKLYGKEAHFGEVLGKHSDIYGELHKGDFKIISEDSDFISKLEDLLGSSVSGFDPRNYVSHEEDEEEVDEDADPL